MKVPVRDDKSSWIHRIAQNRVSFFPSSSMSCSRMPLSSQNWSRILQRVFRKGSSWHAKQTGDRRRFGGQVVSVLTISKFCWNVDVRKSLDTLSTINVSETSALLSIARINRGFGRKLQTRAGVKVRQRRDLMAPALRRQI
jgi:hypothetical protein